jgi:Uncharacterised nucleotidyltransferase
MLRVRIERLPPEERLLCLAARLDREDHDGRARRLLDGPIDWDRFWSLAQLHEVLPLSWAYLRADADRRASVPIDVAERAERVYFATQIRTSERTAEVGRVLSGMEAAGIEAMVVKGVALVSTVYGSDGLRTFDDLDILVRRRDLDPSRAVLDALGYRTRAVPRFEEVDHRFHDLQYFRPLSGRLQCLELHWDLWDPRQFRSAIDGFWQRARPATIAGADRAVLSDADTLLHLAIHRTRSPLRLRFVCDVAELIRARGATIDWDGLVSRAESVGARTAVHMILDLAAQLLDADVPAEPLRATAPGRLKRAMLERTCGATAMFKPVADDDVRQQPHLVLRVLEQDGALTIARAGARAAVRKRSKWRYNRRLGSATGG